MTLEEIKTILSHVAFRDWQFRAMTKGDGFLVQVVFNAPCVDSGKMKEHHGRKWYVSSHAVKSEVVQSAWAAVQRAIVHEAAEEFYYRGGRIYNPHFDVEDLLTLARTKREEVRAAVKTICGNRGPDHDCDLQLDHEGRHQSGKRWGVTDWANQDQPLVHDIREQSDWGSTYMRDLGQRKMEE